MVRRRWLPLRPDRHRRVFAAQECAVAVQEVPALVGDAEPAVARDVDAQVSRRYHLVHHRAPSVRAPVLTHPERRQPVMDKAHGLLRARAAHDVDEVHRAEPLAGAVARRENPLRILSHVEALGGVQAHVAVAAGRDPFAELLEPPTRRHLTGDAFHTLFSRPICDNTASAYRNVIPPKETRGSLTDCSSRLQNVIIIPVQTDAWRNAVDLHVYRREMPPTAH